MGWQEDHAAWEERWDATFDSDDFLLSVLTDQDIEAVPDGYDDYKIDTIFYGFTTLRYQYRKLYQRCIDEGILHPDD